jgi:L-rhamnose mutarotase
MEKMIKKFKIFIHSDQKLDRVKLSHLLSKYKNYEIHYMPTALNLFELMTYEPDVIVVDNEIQNVMQCHKWNAA